MRPASADLIYAAHHCDRSSDKMNSQTNQDITVRFEVHALNLNYTTRLNKYQYLLLNYD